jgi:protoporphyrinogen oxidase
MVFSKTAIIIGAGPAGLTAAYELLEKTTIKPIVLEMSGEIGGLSQTVVYKENRIDIGGHRFFSKSDTVMNWWDKILPLQQSEHDPADKVMLVRKRKSRIYFLGKFFDYPITMSARTLLNLGFRRTLRIALSYLRSLIVKTKDVQNLEQFFISRFGRELYLTFFKSYTEKVWGIPCQSISAEWGAQRIKGLSIVSALKHFIARPLSRLFASGDISQKHTETSLIEKFLYPKLGPGQLWEEVARIIESKGGEVRRHRKVTRVEHDGQTISAVFGTNHPFGSM